MGKGQYIKYLNNDIYRIKAQELFDKIQEAYAYIKKHKPSLGKFGEYILRDFLKTILPKDIGVAQGFVQGNDRDMSFQCDIIIYKKTTNAIIKSFGDICIIDNECVLSTIEVKARIQRKTFESTLKAFKRLAKMGCYSNYVFIYNAISPQALCSYFKSRNEKSEQFILGESGKYDHGDQILLPQAICNLQSNYCLCQDYVINERDEFGYIAYQLKDDIKAISCLQMFIGTLLHKFDTGIADPFKDKFNIENFGDLDVLYSCGLWQL